MRQPERDLQRAVAQLFAATLPDDVVWTTIGHGGGGRVRGAILKSMGVRPGIPDMMLLWRGRAIFIELKSARGRLSPEQRAMHQAITVAGGVVTTCRSVEEVAEFVQWLGVPMRGRVM